jgi:hypothetical protein
MKIVGRQMERETKDEKGKKRRKKIEFSSSSKREREREMMKIKRNWMKKRRWKKKIFIGYFWSKNFGST